jgi:hypothetical protein
MDPDQFGIVTKFEKFTETHLLKAQAAAAFFYFN